MMLCQEGAPASCEMCTNCPTRLAVLHVQRQCSLPSQCPDPGSMSQRLGMQGPWFIWPRTNKLKDGPELSRARPALALAPGRQWIP